MKLPDFTVFEPFNQLRRSMKAPLVDTFVVEKPIQLTISDLEAMQESGLDISNEELRVLEDGTLAYKDSRVLLHIRDVASYGQSISMPKFHLANCDTLQKMRLHQRFNRYVVSIRTDGQFTVHIMHMKSFTQKIQPLDVCKHCLMMLGYKGYSSHYQHKEVFDGFSIEEYFSLYPRSLIVEKPKYTSADAPLNDYGADWKEISRNYKASKQWVCENPSCSIDLSDMGLRRYLHTHHINGQKNDTRESNLQSLCISCHAEQPYSGHMKRLPEYKNFMMIVKTLRKR